MSKLQMSCSTALIHTLGKTRKVFKAVLLGSPGAHKHDLGEKLAKTFKLTHISVRERINVNIEKSSKFGELAKTAIAKGIMIPNKIQMKFITKEILDAELAGHSWLISGFPVTETQANLLWSSVKLHMAIHVTFPDDVLVANLMTRKKSGTQSELVKLERVLKLIENYKHISVPMLNFFKAQRILHSFYSNNVGDMWEKIEKSVDNHISVFTDEDVH